jgi:hypothetical protein
MNQNPFPRMTKTKTNIPMMTKKKSLLTKTRIPNQRAVHQISAKKVLEMVLENAED